MRFNIIIPAALLFLSSAGGLRAADLKECLTMASANSPAVKSYEEKLSASMSAQKSARRALLPALSVSGEDGYSTYSSGSGLNDGMTGTLGAQLAWDLPKVLAGYQRLAGLETDKSRLLLEMARRTLARDVEKDYYSLHILASKKADYAEAKAYFLTHIASIEELGDRGVDVKLDLLHANMQLRSLGVTAAGVEADLKSALMSLNSATGGNFKEDDFRFADVPAPAESRVPPGLAATAPETRLNDLELRTAEENYRESGYFYAPTVGLGVNRAITPIDPATERTRAFLSVSLDVFDFGRHTADRKSLLAEREAQRAANIEDLRRLRLSMETLRTGIDNAAATCAAAEAGLSDADKAMKTADEYYRQGKIKETDLLSVFSDYLAAKEQARDALGDYLDKKADLDYIEGAI